MSAHNNDRTLVGNANSLLNNQVIGLDQVYFQPVSAIDKIPVELSAVGDCTFYINTSSTPLTILDRDGCIRVVAPTQEDHFTRFSDSDLRKVYPSSLIIIKSVAHDLNAFDSSLSQTLIMEHVIDQIETLKSVHRPLSDFERCYTSVNRAFRKALGDQQCVVRDNPNRPGVSNIEANGHFIIAIVAVVKTELLHPEIGNYVEASDIVVRMERFTETNNRVKRLVRNPTTLIHPFSLIGLAYNAEGGLSGFDPDINFRMIRVIRQEQRSANTHVHIVNFKRVVKVPIQRSKKGEEDGVYITERNDEGLLRETRYSFEDARSLGIFEYYAEACGEQQEMAKKYVNEELLRKIADLEEAKRVSEAAALQRKNDAARKSDAMKSIAQAVAATAAIVGAILSIIRILS